MTPNELRDILQSPREERGLEFKGPGERDDRVFFALVVQAVLAMANRRDGGVVVVGVGETDGRFEPVGLTADELQTWKSDHVLDGLAEYADPSVDVRCSPVELDGRTFLVIEVSEFEDLPVACKKDFPGTLQRGVFYGRPRRKPESMAIGTQADMRDLIDLATEKRLRHLLEITAGAGASLKPDDSWPLLEHIGGKVAPTIRSRGWWSFVVRPARPGATGFGSLAEMEQALRGTEVHYFGYRFPRLYRDVAPMRHQHFLEQQTEVDEFLEAWRFFDSGAFLWLGGYTSDWKDRELFQDRPLPDNWRHGGAPPGSVSSWPTSRWGLSSLRVSGRPASSARASMSRFDLRH
ncbi:MAG: putative DNA binding domain-containing protein [Gemmatimonadetes bacterium]|nr:putative DNA binding domain-containing protein [Gemmatimonadota bacterium]